MGTLGDTPEVTWLIRDRSSVRTQVVWVVQSPQSEALFFFPNQSELQGPG